MSGVAALFSGKKTDDAIAGLFQGSSTGPIKRDLKQRTVLDIENKAQEDQESEEETNEQQEQVEKESPQTATGNKKRKRVDDNEDLESNYLSKILKDEDEDEDEKNDSTDDEKKSVEDEESRENIGKEVKGTSAKNVDFRESELEKAERTIFVGNVASNVITSKKDYKELKKFFTKYGAIESIRFRSISFDEPLPRKVAFVQQKLHGSRESLNAYVVFKEKSASKKALSANGELLLDLHIRVDSVSRPSKMDNQRTIFVGNLDFEEKDEELWAIFQECGEVESVRIIRDSKTNVGKGFGYVQFKDITAVSKALLLNEKKLGVKKRKLRISRSKRIKPQTRPEVKSQRFERRLTEDQKTKLGRAKKILNKSDRSRAGQLVYEGTRAKEGDHAAGIKNKQRSSKKPRIRQRSSEFKKLRKG